MSKLTWYELWQDFVKKCDLNDIDVVNEIVYIPSVFESMSPREKDIINPIVIKYLQPYLHARERKQQPEKTPEKAIKESKKEDGETKKGG